MEAEKLDSENPELVDLVVRLESTSQKKQRSELINEIVEHPNSDESARLLIDTYFLTMWREIKFDIIKAIGKIPSDRSLEFLFNLILRSNDLPVSRSACFALAQNKSVKAGNFLIGIVKQGDHSLLREAVQALSENFYFSDFQYLRRSRAGTEVDVPYGVLPYYFTALGVSGNSDFYPVLESNLKRYIDEENSTIINALLIAISRIGGKNAVKLLEEIYGDLEWTQKNIAKLAVEKIQLRLNRKIDDAVVEIDTSNAGDLDLKSLREFPKQKAWAAFESLYDDPEVNLACNVRIALFDDERLNEDLNFLKANWVMLEERSKITLLRLHLDTHSEPVITWLNQLTKENLLYIADRVYHTKIVDILLSKLEKHIMDESTISEVNALVSQVNLSLLDDAEVEKVGSKLFAYFKKPGINPDSKGRLFRALGQIGYKDPSVLDSVEVLMSQSHIDKGSIYSYLGSLAGSDAEQLMQKRLSKITKDSSKSDELESIIRTLSRYSHLHLTYDLKAVDTDTRVRNQNNLLKIMSMTPCEKMSTFISDAINTSDFQQKMLAISAARLNMSQTLAEELEKLSLSDNDCIAIRSLDSLVRSRKKYCHRMVFNFLEKNDMTRHKKLKIIENLLPEEGKDYSIYVKKIDRWLKDDVEWIQSDEDRARVINLRDNLEHQSLESNQTHETMRIAGSKTFHLDEKIAEQLKPYENFPETVKSAIRNTEIIFNNPGLFDQNVDKSTILVEYVKAIDLLLQHKLSTRLFLKDPEQLLTAMQSRVYSLKLDDSGLIFSNIEAELQCDQFFKKTPFPKHKLGMLCGDIVTGKIIENQMRSIDGIKAWAMLLLVFMRKFKYQGHPYSNLVPVKDASAQNIGFLASEMVALQDIRNDAAHRGTVLHIHEIESNKQRCFNVLEMIERVI